MKIGGKEDWKEGKERKIKEMGWKRTQIERNKEIKEKYRDVKEMKKERRRRIDV